jgi:hypothetical protein
VPNSLAFEFYLMGSFIEHIMNEVKPKKLCHRPAPSLSRRTVALPRTSGSIIRSGWREAAAITLGWTGAGNFLYKRPSLGAQVAQLVEQRTENPCVGGSIPPLGTIGAPELLGAGCYAGFEGGPQCFAMNELEDHNVLRTAPYVGRVVAAGTGSPLKPFTDRDGEQASLSGRSKSAHNARDHNL